MREALNDAEAKAQQRLREALQKLTDQLIAEKRKALANQKLHFEAVAKRVAEQRDRYVLINLRPPLPIRG